MTQTVKTYGIRYMVEPWNKPPVDESNRVMPGIRVSKTDYGYCDEIFIASIVHGPSGPSVALVDSRGGTSPDPQMLRDVHEAIEHYVETHT